ncbi:MFS transporter [Actinorhabdospora filicis]|uniref:MFS transporter n=2 Tax=Actinorhabdospora filicis TaxID=1785913 RepID=A0A9W6SPK3_9ACTN|nr:MFS transporter [Actinorhabdospora filicis]
MRLLDLHAASCAGDTLVAVGLAGTIFFSVPTDQARGQVALYLLVTMAPFALLAPLVGPVLDRVRHGRRYALAATMLGRAFLVWVAADNLRSLALYPAAFGILLLSRSYGVARSAALPRLLPSSLSLVEAGARASLYGTVAGAVVLPLGILASLAGPQWVLRLAAVVFVAGMVVALRLPPRTDSQPPETVPRLFGKGRRVLTGRLVWGTLLGSGALRACYGFLALFLIFRAREGDFPFAAKLPAQTAVGVVAASLGLGTFIATAVFTKLAIKRPLLVQTAALAATVTVAAATVAVYNLATVAVLCFTAAFASGAAKLAVDAVIQERVPPEVRASAFAHSETLLILAWVAGGALGLVPVTGALGLAGIGALLLAATVRTALAARVPDPLTGTPSGDAEEPPDTPGEDGAPPGYHLYRPGKRSRAQD